MALKDRELKKPANGKNNAEPLPIDPDSGPKATATKEPVLSLRLMTQVADALWIPDGTSDEVKTNYFRSAILLLQGIKPTDEIEGMLAAQMVATYSAAMECLRRSMIPSQTFAGRDQNLKHASKLLAIYARQMDALNKNRGKGQQKVTVEHVTVQSGGQAVVGNVETAQNPPKPESREKEGPKTIEHKPGMTLDLTGDRRTVAVRTSRAKNDTRS
jgi:hypothetical protein